MMRQTKTRTEELELFGTSFSHGDCETEAQILQLNTKQAYVYISPNAFMMETVKHAFPISRILLGENSCNAMHMGF